MHRVIAAVLAVTSCASMAQAQVAQPAPTGSVLTLAQALDLAGAHAPSVEAADAGLRASSAARRTAGLRPNPTINTDIENVGGSRAYDVVEAPKQTVSIGLPVELGGKRSARIAVAEAQGQRAGIDKAIAEADLRLSVTKAYVEAVAADRRLASARDQAALANDGLHAAHVRVTAGRASPLEEQRADVLRINAGGALDRAVRLAELARGNLARRIGRPAIDTLDQSWFDRVDSYGPARPLGSGHIRTHCLPRLSTSGPRPGFARSQAAWALDMAARPSQRSSRRVGSIMCALPRMAITIGSILLA